VSAQLESSTLSGKMSVNRRILEQVIAASAEPLVIVRVDHPDWPVVLSNQAFEAIGGEDTRDKPFADVIEQLVGRELALEISETVRSQQETSFPVELGGKEYLLALKPLSLPSEEDARFYVAFWRGGSGTGAVAGSDMHHALLKAKRRIRDLSRDDPVTGLLNRRAFREVLEHDWAVAAREKSTLSLVVFSLDDFDAYIDVFGRHAADSCLRRVGQAVRRCLRRASDVVGRLDGAELVVLSHASDEDGVREFASRISSAVRELGLHHPRSTVSRFVTVSFRIGVGNAAEKGATARKFIDELLSAGGK
jgi:diguanylate cyclase (GGDEF)-like protein